MFIKYSKTDAKRNFFVSWTGLSVCEREEELLSSGEFVYFSFFAFVKHFRRRSVWASIMKGVWILGFTVGESFLWEWNVPEATESNRKL